MTKYKYSLLLIFKVYEIPTESVKHVEIIISFFVYVIRRVMGSILH